MKKTLLALVLLTVFIKAEAADRFSRNNEVVRDSETGLMWQDNEDVKTTERIWQDSINYCENLTFAGYSDWRLPDVKELSSIVDDTKYNPAIYSVFRNTAASYYWSSTSVASNASFAWGVDFSYGHVYDNAKANSYYARCMRSGQ